MRTQILANSIISGCAGSRAERGRHSAQAERRCGAHECTRSVLHSDFKGRNVAQELYQNVPVLMLCYLLKIFSFRVTNFFFRHRSCCCWSCCCFCCMYLRRNSRGALRAPVEVRGKVHTAEAAAAPAAAGSVTDCHATVKHAN